ncbi:hypothetical protein L3X38_010170 [Prunus dulcis]|uniref:Integrase catalytic domain-containing protein n=1 Tax=Prunus dulcis TaxID=3755 RepID=A0AAD4ZDS3_PRUDU|nr:hypothetical protein L3X38_010170 [Prunus dulcis]
MNAQIILSRTKLQSKHTQTLKKEHVFATSGNSNTATALAGQTLPNGRYFNPTIPIWVLHVDGLTNQQGCGAGLVLIVPDEVKIEYALHFNFRTSNNEAILAVLGLAEDMGARQINIQSDSQLGYYVLREIHRGICSDHSSSCFLLTMHCNAIDLGRRQVKYIVVAVDYFRKWVEAEALATITAARIEDFLWTHIYYRLDIPYTIITDDNKQFDSDLFRQFCNRLKINLFFALPAQPQSNG